VLLTIRRGWCAAQDAPAADSWEFYSGTENVYAANRLRGVGGTAQVDDAGAHARALGDAAETAPPARTCGNPASGPQRRPLPRPPATRSSHGREVAMDRRRQPGQRRNLNANVLYNAQVLSFVRRAQRNRRQALRRARRRRTGNRSGQGGVRRHPRRQYAFAPRLGGSPGNLLSHCTRPPSSRQQR
jgi:hypothetical protein